MGILRTDNISGLGGRNAANGSVYFDGRDDVTALQVIAAASNADFTFGTGDFTIEFWINHGATGSYDLLYDGRRDSSSDVAPMIYLVSGKVRYYTAASDRITGTTDISHDSWHHIALCRSSGSTKLFLNGVQEGSTYSDSNSYVAKLNRPVIGGEGPNFANNPFGGFISNLRVVKGTALYTSNFTPPTQVLKAIEGTVLLCCQDSDNPTAEATGKEIFGQGGVYYGKRYSNLATNGNLETGTTTNWTNAGCATFEISNFSHSGSYSIHAVSNSNGDAIVYTIPVTLDTHRRYKISAYINCVGPLGTSARAKMKIGSGTAGNENYESRTAGQAYSGLGNWTYVEWIGLATADTTHVTFNESSSNAVNDYYVDDLRIELWYPEENENILANPNFYSTATGWSFSSTPSGEYTISGNKLNVADNGRTNDAYATQQLFSSSIKEGRYRIKLDYNMSSGGFDVGIGNNRIWSISGSGCNFWELDAGSTNSNFRIITNQHGVGEFYSVGLFRIAEPKAPVNIPPLGVDDGITFTDNTKFDTLLYMVPPKGTTESRNRGRGLLMGGAVSPGATNTTQIKYFDIASQGITDEFGQTTGARRSTGSLSSSTRGLMGGGFVAPTSPAHTVSDVIDYVTIATTANAVDFGDMQSTGYAYGTASNETRGLFAGGYRPNNSAVVKTTDLITIASKGDASNFGDLFVARRSFGGLASPTRGIFFGGAPGTKEDIDYVTIATAAAALDFGNLTAGGRDNVYGGSNSTRGVMGGGRDPNNVNIIDYITIASEGNAVDFGDLLSTVFYNAATSNGIRTVWVGNTGITNTMEYVTIATTGNSIDWGDQGGTIQHSGGACSDSHGGLS